MDVDNIIEEIGKYYFVVCDDKKCDVIAVSDSKPDVKTEAKKYVKKNIDAMEGSTIYLVEFVRPTEEEFDPEKHIFLPVPIPMEITDYDVIDGKLKESKKKFYQKVFFSLKYLKKNEGINEKDVAEMIVKHKNETLEAGLFVLLF